MCIYLWFVESKDRWYWIHQFIKIICWYPSLPAFYDLLQTLFALFIKHDQTINKIFSWSYGWITLSDKISSDKTVQISAWCRKVCPMKNIVRRKFCPIFQYKSQAKIGQNCRIFGLVSKILSDEIFCPSKILSDEILSDKVYLY